MVLIHDHLQLRDSVGISPTSLPRGTFDLTAFVTALTEHAWATPNVEVMVDTPKRSVRESIGQLVVIAILIAILVGALLLLRQYVDSNNASDSSSLTATYLDSAFVASWTSRSGDAAMVSFTNSRTAYAAASCSASTFATTSSFNARNVATTARR